MSHFHVRQTARCVNSGGVIAYPTEAVFGLGCLPEDFYSVRKILELKNRPLSKGLILVAASIEQLSPYISFSNEAVKTKVAATWPGPVTWIVSASENVPYWVTGHRETIAVRVSAHPLVQAICTEVGAIVSTSANPGGYSPAKNAFKVRQYFQDEIDYILPGETGNKGQPTEIRDALNDKVLRASD